MGTWAKPLSFIIAIILTTWTVLSYYSHSTQTEIKTKGPDSYMETVNAVMMNPEGFPKIKIMTPKMIYFAENDTSTLIDPKITIYRQSTQPWLITAQFAKTENGVDHIHFWDHVTIHHAEDAASPDTHMQTHHLTIHTKGQTAETTDPVTFIQPNMLVKAVGMMAHLDTGDIRLFREAQGEYVPN